MRGRLLSFLLIPLIISFVGFQGEDNAPRDNRRNSSTVNGEIELELPANRRVPSKDDPGGSKTSAQLQGRVIDAKRKTPIEGAEVSIPELDLRTVTNDKGEFFLGNIEPRDDSYEVLITRPGYVSCFADAELKEKQLFNCEYRLKPLGW